MTKALRCSSVVAGRQSSSIRNFNQQGRVTAGPSASSIFKQHVAGYLLVLRGTKVSNTATEVSWTSWLH